MADAGIIVRVYPLDGRDDMLIKAMETSSHYKPPRIPFQSKGKYPIYTDDLDSLPYLEHRFDDVHRGPSAIVYGRNPDTCDVVLPQLNGISRQHFVLTYSKNFADGRPRLVVRDVGSSYGTRVMYDGRGKEKRSNFDWVISGFELPATAKSIVVKPHDFVELRLVVARHNIASHEYAANVERFLRGSTSLGRDIAPGPAITDPIILHVRWLARGAFGSVSLEWNVSTGDEYACKQPLERAYKRQYWEQEIRILQSLSHAHIVHLCSARIEPYPIMYLEYLKFGNLSDQHSEAPFSHGECLVILQQSLSALSYLHERPTPLVHRDIKPENILVKHRDRNCNPSFLHVKLSDFGLCKDSTPRTYCGTRKYMPPEVQFDGGPYTTALDIWSLGVVLLQIAYGLPQKGEGGGLEWHKAIVREVSRHEPKGLAGILQHMLVTDPRARSSAAACLREVSLLLASSYRLASAPVSSLGAARGPAPKVHPTVSGRRRVLEPPMVLPVRYKTV